MVALSVEEAAARPTAAGKRVIIVGAGVSGLATAQKLRSKGVNPIMFEGRNRVGGRVMTTRLGTARGTPPFLTLSKAPDSHAAARGGTPVDIGASMLHAFENDEQWVAKHARDANIRAPLCAGKSLYEPTQAAGWYNAGRRIPQYTISWLHDFALNVQLCAASAAEYARKKGLEWTVEDTVTDGIAKVEKTNKLSLSVESREILQKILNRGQAYCCPMKDLSLKSVKEWNHGAPPAYPPRRERLLLRPEKEIRKQAHEYGGFVQTPPQPISSNDEPWYKKRHDRLVLDGYSPFLIDRLAKNLDVCFGTTVREVRVNESGPKVTVTVNDGTKEHQVHADYVVVTVPLGVLKKKKHATSITFVPELSPEKQTAIRNFGMGIHNKVVLLFKEKDVFWPEKMAQFNCPDTRFQFMNLHALGHKGLLVAHVFNATEYARGYHGKPDDAVVKDLMQVLQDMFAKTGPEEPKKEDELPTKPDPQEPQKKNEPVATPEPEGATTAPEYQGSTTKGAISTENGHSHSRSNGNSNGVSHLPWIDPPSEATNRPKKLPYPIDYVVTRWDCDPFAFGSYSFWKSGSEWYPRELGKTEHERILFGGEHTDADGWQCVDGAYKSGIRAGHEILVDCGDIPREAEIKDIPPMSVRPEWAEQEGVLTKKRRRTSGGSKNGKSKNGGSKRAKTKRARD